MRHLLSALWLGCALLTGCNVDRLPLDRVELVADASTQDTSRADHDAYVMDDTGVDASQTPDAAADAANDTTGDAMVDASVDTTVDASVTEDAYVPPRRFEGPCSSDHDCNLDEICVRSSTLINSLSYCAQRCTNNYDCATGPTGASTPRCTSSGRCRLPCDAVLGAGCPASMVCQDLLLILPADDGTCSFPE